MSNKRVSCKMMSYQTWIIQIVLLIATTTFAFADSECQSLPQRLRASPRQYLYDDPEIKRPKRLLVGLFPIHKDNCNTLLSTKNYNGFQRAEAMIYGVKYINELVKNQKRVVGLSALILDTCSNPVSSIEATLNVMKNPFAYDLPLAGFVGASYSSNTIPVSMVLQTYNVTMLSFAATAIELSNKEKHPLFARLVPSDVGQAQVVYHLLKRFGWKTIEILTAPKSDYSTSLRDKFRLLVEHEASETGIVICEENQLTGYKSLQEEDQIRSVLLKVMKSRSDGVIVFLPADYKPPVTEAIADNLAKYESLKNTSLYMISTDSWDVTEIKNKKAAEYLNKKSFVVIPATAGFGKLHHGQNLTKYFDQLSPKSAPENPWIQDLWQEAFGCGNSCYDKTFDWSKLSMDSKVDFVFDTILAYSDAIERCQDNKCSENSEDFFRNYILATNIRAQNDSDCQIQFDCNGDRVGKYGIYRLESVLDISKYWEVGKWSTVGERGRISFHFPEVERESRGAAKQSCRPICDYDEYEEFGADSKCCYVCQKLIQLGPRFIRLGMGEKTNCSFGEWPNQNYTACESLKMENLVASNGWAVMAILISIVGILLGLAFLGFSLKHYKHVEIKNSSRELSIFTWLGVMISHINTLLIFYTDPSLGKCSLIRFTMTIGYTFILSSLYLKTNRLFRVFYAQFRQNSLGIFGSLKYSAPKYQVLFCLGLILVQVVIILIWILSDSAEAIKIYPDARMVCKMSPFHLMLAQLYNAVLCIITTTYSFFTRGLPENFNESRFINLSMLSICMTWITEGISWVFRSDNAKYSSETQRPERDWAISAAVSSFSASLVLVFLFSHRVLKVMKANSKSDDEEDEPEILAIGGVSETKT